MSNRNFGYYGNNRLKNQTYSRNLYNNNINGKQIINNPQNTNGDSSNFNTYHEGAQTTYTRGLIGEMISIGGIFGIPPPIPRIPSCPSKTMTVSSHITTQAELDALQGATIIIGDLFIETAISNLNALSCLQVLNGYFDISNNSNLYNISLPNLETVDSYINITGNTSNTISFPNLETVNGGYMFINSNNVNSISFPTLTTLTVGDMKFIGNSITSIVLPKLELVGGGITIISNNNLNAISFPEIININNHIGSGNFALNIQNNGATGTTLNGFLNLTTMGGISPNGIFLNGTISSKLQICQLTYNAIDTNKGSNSIVLSDTLIGTGYCT